MTRFIHVAGLSGAGKKSLIRRLLLPEAESLRRRLGLDGGTIAAHGYAFDPGDIRDATADVVIHQWQWATDHYVLDLLADRPGDRHGAILLHRPAAGHRLDILLHRPPWRPTVAELRAQGRHLRAHVAGWAARGLAVRVLDGRTFRRERDPRFTYLGIQ